MVEKKYCEYCGNLLSCQNAAGFIYKCSNHRVSVVFYFNIWSVVFNGIKYRVELYRELKLISIYNADTESHIKTLPFISKLTPENFEDKVERLLLFI